MYVKILMLSLLGLIGHASTQPLSSRGCASNLTANTYTEFLGRSGSFKSVNASGSFSVKGFTAPDQSESAKTWTWSTGIQYPPNGTGADLVQAVWLDTHGVDLAARDLGYDLCYMALTNFPRDQQQQGQGDKGDCMTFLGQNCVEDLNKAAQSQAANPSPNNYSPCNNLQNNIPISCAGFKSSGSFSSYLPEKARQNCTFGLGDPDLDVVDLFHAYKSNINMDQNVLYDTEVTHIVPIVAIAKSNGPPNSTGWADSRVFCLSTPNITDGSRKPAGVPSTGERLCWNAVRSITLAFAVLFVVL